MLLQRFAIMGHQSFIINNGIHMFHLTLLALLHHLSLLYQRTSMHQRTHLHHQYHHHGLHHHHHGPHQSISNILLQVLHLQYISMQSQIGQSIPSHQPSKMLSIVVLSLHSTTAIVQRHLKLYSQLKV